MAGLTGMAFSPFNLRFTVAPCRSVTSAQLRCRRPKTSCGAMMTPGPA